MTAEKVTVRAADGRQLEALATGPADGLAVVLHNGTPAGLMAAPAIAATAAERGVRLVLYARPGYEGSTPDPGRRVASAAADLATVLDALGTGEFVTVERWESPEALKVHGTAEALTALGAALAGKVQGPPVVRRLSAVPAGDPEKGQL